MTDIPENAARARQMYSEGATTRDILAETKLSHWALYHWIAGGPKKDGKRLLPALVKRRMVTRRRILKEDRLTLVDARGRAAGRRDRNASCGQRTGARRAGTRCAHARALLAKTMQSLTALDALHEQDAPKRKASKNESIPRSIDELRRSVAAKLQAIIAQQHSAGDREP